MTAPGPETPRARRRNLPAAKRRRVTVEAVLDLAATASPDTITTAAIAARMNLTHGALFRHFPSKDAIWQAVMAWVAERLLARIRAAADGAESPLAALEAMFLAHARFVADRPGVPRMLFAELQSARDTPAKKVARALLAEYAARLDRLLAAGIAARQLRADLDTRAAATLYIGMIQGLVMQSLIAGDLGRVTAEAPGLFALYRQGIAAR